MTVSARAKSPAAPALARGFAILEQMAASRRGLTHAEIARHSGLAKSTTHHLLATLCDLGYVRRPDKSGRYFIASKLVDLSAQALCSIRLRSEAIPVLRGLQAASGLAVHMAVWDQGEVVLVERLTAQGGPALATWIGKRMDAHCSGCGKAILAHMPGAELDRHIREHGLPRHNENTISSARKLKEALETIRRTGYAVDDEEDELGFRCVAAPVFEGSAVAAAISVAGTTAQIRLDNMSRLIQLVTAAARRISGLFESGQP